MLKDIQEIIDAIEEVRKLAEGSFGNRSSRYVARLAGLVQKLAVVAKSQQELIGALIRRVEALEAEKKAKNGVGWGE